MGILPFHLPERVLQRHTAAKERNHNTAAGHYQITVIFNESLRDCQCKNSDDRKNRINETCTKPGKKTGLMSITQRLLYNENSNRPQRDRRTDAYDEAF